AVEVNRATGGRQFPELSISLLGEFFFNSADTDLKAWSKLRSSRNLAELRSFIDRYPSSPLVHDAQEKIEAIERAARLEAERLESETAERKRAEQQKENSLREAAERERLSREKAEHERLAAGREEQEKLAREAAEPDRLRDQAERERLVREQAASGHP